MQPAINVSPQQTENVELTRDCYLTANECDSESDSNSKKWTKEDDYERSMLKTGKKKVHCVLVKQELPQNLHLLSRACGHRAISSRTRAQLASALLKDLNVVTYENQAAVAGKSKIFRERIKSRQAASSTCTSELMALYFDGRRYDTITKEVVGGKSVQKSVQEGHISLAEEPVHSKYYGHVTPVNGTGKEIVTSILKFMKENSIDGKTIKAIGCGGTATNAGALNGLIRLFEKSLQHPLQSVVLKLT